MSDHRFDQFTFLEIIEEFYRRMEMMKKTLEDLKLMFKDVEKSKGEGND